MVPNRFSLFCVVAFVLVLISGCTDSYDYQRSKIIRVQSSSEPDIINPAISRKSIASAIESHMYLPLMESQSPDGNWSPVLLKQWQFRKNEGTFQYILDFRDNAFWSDGELIGPQDLVFTIKMALNPYLSNRSWVPYMSLINKIEKESPGRVIISLDEPYILADEFIASMTLYPHHIFDPDGIIRSIPLETFTSGNYTGAQDTLLREVAEEFNAYGNSQTQNCVVSGPYNLVDWTVGQRLTLEKVNDWWGERMVGDSSFNYSQWDTIQYIFIEDLQNAINSFVNDQVDLLTSVRREDSSIIADSDGEIISFPTLQLLYIAANNQNELLSQVAIRNALNLGINRSDLIRRLFDKDTEPAFGPIHPDKSYYKGFQVEYDPKMASGILEEIGCKDIDGDGVLECATNKGMRALKFEIWTTRSEISRNVATLLKSYWKRIGVELTIQSGDFSSFLPELQNKTFDLATLALRQNNIKDDPYPLWHSSQAQVTGKNYQGLSDAKLDSLLLALRECLDTREQNKMYAEFQERFSELQPVFFFAAPVKVLAIKDDIELFRIKERPGYDIARSRLKK